MKEGFHTVCDPGCDCLLIEWNVFTLMSREMVTVLEMGVGEKYVSSTHVSKIPPGISPVPQHSWCPVHHPVWPVLLPQYLLVCLPLQPHHPHHSFLDHQNHHLTGETSHLPPQMHFNRRILLLFFLVAQTLKNMPSRQDTWVRSLGQEGPLEKGVAAHSSILAWVIPVDRAWGATVHSVTQSQTRLKRLSTHACKHPLKYSCLKNSTDRGAWQATVHRVTKNQTGQ